MDVANLSVDRSLQRLPASGLPDWAGIRRDGSGRVDASEIGVRFEQIFIQQLVREMSSTLQEGFFGESSGSHVYQGFFETFLAEKIARSGGLGIAPEVRKQVEGQIAAEEPERLFVDDPSRTESGR